MNELSYYLLSVDPFDYLYQVLHELAVENLPSVVKGVESLTAVVEDTQPSFYLGT